MRGFAKFVILAGLLVPLLASIPARAQATRTWVSGVGDDANPCSLTAPCKTFAGAISKTAASGEINCLDPGAFGSVTITKSMTISCEEKTAGILAPGSAGIIVNAGAADKITLRGLDIEGAGTGVYGIRYLAAKSVVVENTRINGFAASNGLGISFAPTTVNASLVVSNTIVSNNGNSSIGGGIAMQPTGSGTGTVSLTNVRIVGNYVGLGGTGPNSVIAVVKDSVISNNRSTALSVDQNVFIRVGYSTVSGNAGLATFGNVTSFGNNQINGNNPDTTPGVISLQ